MVTRVTVNQKVPGSILGLGIGNFGNLFVVFPAISNRLDCVILVKDARKLFIDAIHRARLRTRLYSLFDVTARHAKPGMSVSNVSISLF